MTNYTTPSPNHPPNTKAARNGGHLDGSADSVFISYKELRTVGISTLHQ